MIDYAKRFAWWFLAMATVAGLYLAADKAGVAKWFVGVTLASLIFASTPTLVSWFSTIRGYPKLFAEAEELRGAIANLTTNIAELEQNILAEYQRGINEGQMQRIGSQLAGLCREVPSIIAISSEDDAVLLVTTFNDDSGLLVGARFDVQVEATMERRGVVEVIDLKPFTRTATLSCVEATTPAFWENLAQRAPIDPSPPPGIHLTRYAPDATLAYLTMLAPAGEVTSMEE